MVSMDDADQGTITVSGLKPAIKIWSESELLEIVKTAFDLKGKLDEARIKGFSESTENRLRFYLDNRNIADEYARHLEESGKYYPVVHRNMGKDRYISEYSLYVNKS